MAARFLVRACSRLAAATALVGGGAAAAAVVTSDDPAATFSVCAIVPVRLARDTLTAASIVADYKYSLWGLEEGSVEYVRAKHEVHTRSANRLQELCFQNDGIDINLGKHMAQLVGETTAGGSDPIQEKELEGQLEGQDVEEEGECGFCLFMKGGPCREEFIAWEKCVEEAEKNEENIVDKCFEVTGLLRKCMEAHTDYYEPILRAEKAMEEEAARELGRDQEANSDLAETKMDTQEEKN